MRVPKVLVVDDTPSIRFLIRTNMELAGIEVEEAIDGVVGRHGPLRVSWTFAEGPRHRDDRCPREDSNLRFRLRRAALYPLSYGGRCGQLRCEPTPRPIP